MSGVQLVLTQPATFMVYVNGEVHITGEAPAWGLSRLSTLTGGNLTAFSSIRDITVKSTNGKERVFDLFRARRFGDLTQDPYLRPGDVITFNRIKRFVTINGAVERPGSYQLLEGENIKELIELYGNGFTPVADRNRLELMRIKNSKDITGDKVFLTENNVSNNFVLENFDVISVPTIIRLRSVMFVEGAIITQGAAATTLHSSNRLPVQFTQGDTYAALVRRNTEWFSAMSDTENSYVLRREERIPININSMLFDVSFLDDILIEENDVFIIPFRQNFVSVTGAVRFPGRFPHIPDRNWEYYIGLAGGFMAGLNAGQAVTISDKNGKRMKKSDPITPETTITARTNHSLYYFNQYAPPLLTALSIVTAFFTVRAYMNQ